MSMNTTTARGIRCGHCNGRHVSVTDVRSCSQGIAVSNVEGMSATDIARLPDPESERIESESDADDPVPAKPHTNVPAALVKYTPAGRYAIDFEGKLRFFKIDRPTEGRWAGFVFVKEQAGDNEHPVKTLRRQEVLEAIAAEGAEVCSTRYGRELGHCGVCGRTLTDEQSRAQGIGPVCIAKMGW